MNLFRSFLSIFVFINISKNFYLTEAKILLKIHIYNYKNTDSIKYDGSYCEAFHFLNDHCDPQFHICISGKNQCDILNKNIIAVDNKKIIYEVFSQIIQSDNFINSLSITVKVDDADANGSHDHIAKFSSMFIISKSNENYQSYMAVSPKNLNVGLQARVSISCAENYQGEKCDKRTDEISCLSSCKNGKCYLENINDKFACKCNEGWTSIYCYDKTISTSSVISTTKLFNSKTFSKQYSLSSSPKQFSEDSNEKYRTHSLDLTTKVIIICLLLLLSICVISLALVIKSWHRKNVGNNFLHPVLRPLPPIVYQKNQAINKTAESTLRKTEELQWENDSPNERCIIKTNHSKHDNDLIQIDDFPNSSENPYEIPLISNIETTSFSDEDEYEMPIKYN